MIAINEKIEDKSGMERSVSPERSEITSTLSWEDLLHISSQHWGLRHLSSLEAAKQEMAEGINNGDALSLSHPNQLIPNEAIKISDDLAKQLRDMSFDIIAKFVEESYRSSILLQFEKAVKEFIADSVAMDVNGFYEDKQYDQTSVEQIMHKLIHESSAFIIARFDGADLPYDINQYYNLGKCGKRSVDASDLVANINVSDIKEAAALRSFFTREELASQITAEKFKKIVGAYTELIWCQLMTLISQQRQFHQATN